MSLDLILQCLIHFDETGLSLQLISEGHVFTLNSPANC